MHKLLKKSYLQTARVAFCSVLCLFGTAQGAERPEYLHSFDPAKGFKPAQRDLTEVFLQIAGSLEHYGSPEPYLRHMAKEHARIEALYRRKFGTAPKSYRPGYLTDEYIDRLCANWKLLSPKLGLEPFAKEVGHDMREAIKGTRGTGTMLVEIFNEHQARVFDAMAGKATQPADFGALQTQLIKRLGLDKTRIDDTGFSIPQRDAVSYAIVIHGLTMKLFQRLDQGLKPADAERVKSVIRSIFVDAGEMAQSELQAGISEWAFGRMSATAK
jgi:hypothetical protein